MGLNGPYYVLLGFESDWKPGILEILGILFFICFIDPEVTGKLKSLAFSAILDILEIWSLTFPCSTCFGPFS